MMRAIILFLFMASSAQAGDAASLIKHYAAEYHVPLSLAMRVAKVESGVRCVSGRYYGPLQIAYRTAKGIGYRGSQSQFRASCALQTQYGMKHLAMALKRGGSHVRAACLHNRGLGAKCSGHTHYTRKVFR